MSKLFSCDYDHYDMVKCRRNMNFEEMDTEPRTGKTMRKTDLNFNFSQAA